MALGGVLGVACISHRKGVFTGCHRNGAPLLVDEGLGIFTSLRASQSPSTTPEKSGSPVLNTGKFCGGLSSKCSARG